MKKIILLVFLLIFIPTLAVSAEVAKKPEIIVKDDALLMDQTMINEFRDEILTQYPKAKRIEIYEYIIPQAKIVSGESYKIQEKNGNVFNNIIGKKATQVVVSTQNIVSTYNKASSDYLAFSIEKGSQQTLTKDISSSIKSSFDGTPFNTDQLGSAVELAGTYKQGGQYFGPEDSEGSFSNREFRVRFYQEEGYYVQTRRTLFNVGKTEEEVAHGQYTKPTKVILYSIDFS